MVYLPILSDLNLLILLTLMTFIYLKSRAGNDGYRNIYTSQTPSPDVFKIFHCITDSQ